MKTGLILWALLITGSSLTGEFSKTCNDASYHDDGFLIARCQRNDGSWACSSIQLNDYIANIDSHLTWEQRDFALTCVNCNLSGSTLNCFCQDKTGIPANTSLNLDEHIANLDGQLSYQTCLSAFVL